MDIRRIPSQQEVGKVEKDQEVRKPATSFDRLLDELTSESQTLRKEGETEAVSRAGDPLETGAASERILAAIERASEAQERFRELRSLLRSAYEDVAKGEGEGEGDGDGDTKGGPSD